MLPLRSALQQSLNVVAVRLLSIVGVEKGAEVVKRFGLPNPMKRVLPSALGALYEATLVEAGKHPAAHPAIFTTSSETGSGIAELRTAIVEAATS